MRRHGVRRSMKSVQLWLIGVLLFLTAASPVFSSPDLKTLLLHPVRNQFLYSYGGFSSSNLNKLGAYLESNRITQVDFCSERKLPTSGVDSIKQILATYHVQIRRMILSFNDTSLPKDPEAEGWHDSNKKDSAPFGRKL